MALFNNARIKQMIFGSWAIAGGVLLLCVLDLALGIPFARSIMFDVMMALGAGLVGYLGWDAYKDLPS